MPVHGVQIDAIAKFREDCKVIGKDGKVARIASFKAIKDFCHTLTTAKYDAHICICGQNGTGKSMAAFALGKEFIREMDMPDFKTAFDSGRLDFIYSYIKRETFEKKVKEKHNCVFILDEARTLFDYKRSMTAAQNNLYNTIEVARSHYHTYISCTRDYNKLDNNYRNGKLAILVRIWDRVEKEGKTEFSFAHVYVGNPMIEMEDKFYQDYIYSNDINQSVWASEHIPSFVGTLKIEHVSKYGVSEDDIKLYETEKEIGVTKYANKYGADDDKRAARLTNYFEE